jgi:hypothetical protein
MFYVCGFCVSWKFVIFGLWFMCLLEIHYLLDLGFSFLFLRSLMCDSLIFLCILCVLKV